MSAKQGARAPGLASTTRQHYGRGENKSATFMLTRIQIKAEIADQPKALSLSGNHHSSKTATYKADVDPNDKLLERWQVRRGDRLPLPPRVRVHSRHPCHEHPLSRGYRRGARVDSISANIARAAMHEHRMAASELRMVEQHLFGRDGTEVASIADKTLGLIASMSATAAAYGA